MKKTFITAAIALGLSLAAHAENVTKIRQFSPRNDQHQCRYHAQS